MKTIPLTRGLVALVDDADFDWLSAYKWHAKNVGKGRFYAAFGSRMLLMHRMILPGVPEVDHYNRNTLDNQRHNLRPATHTQNLHNSGRHRDGSSGFKGVSWSKIRHRWRAQIQSDYLGLFSTEEAGARAYDAEAVERFGEFAYVNFPRKANT